MGFKGGQRTPAALGHLRIQIDRIPSGEVRAQYRVSVEYDTGEVDYYEGNLIPELTPQEQTQAQSFVETLWARAEEQLGLV